MSNLWLDMFTTGTHANRPTSPPNGVSVALYYETDTSQLFYWTGSAWSAVSTASVPASTTALGPVKGDNSTVSIAGDGTLSIAKATAAHIGGVKGGQASVNIDANGVLSANAYSFAGAVSQYASSGQLFATQGNQFTPLVNMTIDQVVASWYGAATIGHRYLCGVFALNSIAGRQITSPIGTATVNGTGANQDLTYTFSPALSLVAGTSYAIVITDLDAATTTTSNSIGGIAASGGIYPMYANIPTSNSANDQRIVLAKNTPPGIGDTFTSVGGTAAIGIRAQY